ncbi:hypothetical protein [Nitrosopumilus sp.]|uniref:hypothetical protein n=1 Tax=Nitrosopumilus sp. TaxID=2024843 RepID=UPI002627FA29|nr:hypothetical protein [Nitrosopumilus sp.]
MKKSLRIFLGIITITVFVVIAIFWLQYGPNYIKENYDPNNPIQQFMGILFLTSAGIFFRKLKDIPKYKQQANLWEWFMILLVPTPLAFLAVIHSEISLYWGMFAFLLASTFWISIGVYNGTHYEEKWNKDYKFALVTGIYMLVSIGVMIHILFSIIPPEKLLP